MPKSSNKGAAPALVFVDTNIFLDFYRVTGSQDSLKLLRHIDGNHEHFITSFQVEMEFKKHRQEQILSAHKALSGLKVDRSNEIPAFLAQSHQSTALSKINRQVSTLKRKLQERTGRVLGNPTTADPVYKVAQRLFRSNTACNLKKGHSAEGEILEKARHRFQLGCPPRKPQNTSSLGDALNWEWIIRCASKLGRDVVIVSRDGDFGSAFDKTPILNDWLDQEFRQAVSGRRAYLTKSLAEGLRKAEVAVPEVETQKEQRFLDDELAKVWHGRQNERQEALRERLLKSLARAHYDATLHESLEDRYQEFEEEPSFEEDL